MCFNLNRHPTYITIHPVLHKKSLYRIVQIVCRGFKSNTSVMSFLTLQYYQGHLSPQKALLILMESLVNLEDKFDFYII